MKYAAIAFLTMMVVSPACADDLSLAIRVTFFECLTPKSDPACVSFDETSKPKSCPDCLRWRRVTVDEDTKAKARPQYDKPNDFADDMARQMFGKGLPRNTDGQPISIKHFYENHEKYGWVEIPASQSREGSLAVLPHTAGVVVAQNNREIDVVYSSTKRGGDVTKTNLDHLLKGAEPVFVLPASFLENAAEAAPPVR